MTKKIYLIVLFFFLLALCSCGVEQEKNPVVDDGINSSNTSDTEHSSTSDNAETEKNETKIKEVKDGDKSIYYTLYENELYYYTKSISYMIWFNENDEALLAYRVYSVDMGSHTLANGIIINILNKNYDYDASVDEDQVLRFVEKNQYFDKNQYTLKGENAKSIIMITDNQHNPLYNSARIFIYDENNIVGFFDMRLGLDVDYINEEIFKYQGYMLYPKNAVGFPKVNGEYQDISKEDILNCFDDIEELNVCNEENSNSQNSDNQKTDLPFTYVKSDNELVIDKRSDFFAFRDRIFKDPDDNNVLSYGEYNYSKNSYVISDFAIPFEIYNEDYNYEIYVDENTKFLLDDRGAFKSGQTFIDHFYFSGKDFKTINWQLDVKDYYTKNIYIFVYKEDKIVGLYVFGWKESDKKYDTFPNINGYALDSKIAVLFPMVDNEYQDITKEELIQYYELNISIQGNKN
ncbi:MAG: hypothetical protein IJS58_06240 [Bacilli bacterium]|nr:hypothetical protein [Bacilli bacterium]